MDIRMIPARKTVATRYPARFRNKNREIRYRRVQTIFTRGSSRWRILFAG